MPIYSPTGFLDVTNATLRGSKIVTTSNVGVANLNPLNTLSVGSNLQVEDTGSNVLVIHGNAVNGNNAPTDDAWVTLELVVPGQAYEGDLTPDEGIDGVSQTDRMLLVVGLVLIAGLLWAVARP